jgi:hypothetical protein
MMMYDMGRQYHAERVMSVSERRRADEQAGQLVASVTRLWQRYLGYPARVLRMAGVTIGG